MARYSILPQQARAADDALGSATTDKVAAAGVPRLTNLKKPVDPLDPRPTSRIQRYGIFVNVITGREERRGEMRRR
jgi:hypothetical protein